MRIKQLIKTENIQFWVTRKSSSHQGMEKQQTIHLCRVHSQLEQRGARKKESTGD